MDLLWLILSMTSLTLQFVESRSKCYSCASANMKTDFITKERGPPNRKQEPLTFDNNCDEDPWIIKQRSTVACETKCFKWQQLLNNSGSFSMMTFRGCYDTMFDMSNPSTLAIPDHNFCTAGEVQLSCLSDASVIEHSCWVTPSLHSIATPIRDLRQWLGAISAAKRKLPLTWPEL
ncbi:hypothetical protein RB195_013644 [Necator americanus]|uniref:Uncharacterized protein n=1 Tax=Necator americanus TaxID=51031 RepID=A0ABR1DWG8_NECAM